MAAFELWFFSPSIWTKQQTRRTQSGGLDDCCRFLNNEYYGNCTQWVACFTNAIKLLLDVSLWELFFSNEYLVSLNGDGWYRSTSQNLTQSFKNPASTTTENCWNDNFSSCYWTIFIFFYFLAMSQNF